MRYSIIFLMFFFLPVLCMKCEDDKQMVFNAIQSSDIVKLKNLFSSNKCLVKARDDENMTPLHRAAQMGSIKIIDVLLEHRAPLDARDRWGDTPLVLACCTRHTKAALHLIKRGADCNATLMNGLDFYSPEMSITPLEVACQNNLPKVVRVLLGKRGAKKDVQKCLFCCAAQNNDDKVTPILVQYGLKHSACIYGFHVADILYVGIMGTLVVCNYMNLIP